MSNVIVTIILLAISFFVINLFPMGKAFFANIQESFNEKRTNITEEYERVKDGVEVATETALETKEKVEKTVDAASSAIETVSGVLEKINSLLGGGDENEDDVLEEDAQPEEESSAEVE